MNVRRHVLFACPIKSFLALVAFSMFAVLADAIILYRTDDPAANTTEPTGALADSGWQYEGSFGAYLGTAIAPHFFITAKHLGQVSSKFVYHGANYTIIQGFPDPRSDLQLYKVEETLPSYAPLYEKSDEVGQHLVVIGRGGRRGPERIINGQLRGWNYGASDSVQRWGENQVASIVRNRLYVLFEKAALPNEAHLSSGDSGGAIFLNDAGTWKLAGINFDVDHFASGPDGGGRYDAAMFDERGSYRANGQLVSGEVPVPSGFYAARVSSRLEWIKSIINGASD